MIIGLQILVGFLCLIFGAEWLVRGSVRLAALFGMKPLVIGLTVVAFGTSAPELAVSLVDVYTGSGGDLAVGNAVGSNTLNVLLILGLSALVVPLNVERQVVRLDVPVMIAATLALLWLVQDGQIARWEGMLMFFALTVYIGFLIQMGRRDSRKKRELAKAELAASLGDDQAAPPVVDRSHKQGNPFFKQLGLVLAGLLVLALGCNIFVAGATSLARAMGVSDLLIGLTVVSIGTSLPELVTTVIASARGERDLAVGNIVGSNLFNILCVLGLTSAVAPGPLPVMVEAIQFDIPVTLGVAIICLPIFFTRSEISRWEGVLMLVLYGAYLTYRIMTELNLPMQEPFANLVWYGLFPVTLILLVGSTLKSFKADPLG